MRRLFQKTESTEDRLQIRLDLAERLDRLLAVHGLLAHRERFSENDLLVLMLENHDSEIRTLREAVHALRADGLGERG